MSTISPKLQLQKLIQHSKNIDELKEKLLDKTKDLYFSQNDELLLISNDYTKNVKNMSELERECRSVIVDNNLKIICYTFDSIYYNEDAKEYLIINDNINNIQINKCYEGTLITFYYYNNNWKISTRKSLDANKSYFHSKKSYYELVKDVVGDLDEFTNKLDTNYYYMFVLVHYENINLVNYSHEFGNEYKKLIHIMTRNIEHQEVLLELKENFIIIPERYQDYTMLDNLNQKSLYKFPLKDEGLVIKVYNNDTGKSNILKLQSNAYICLKNIKPNTNDKIQALFEQFQKDKLREHFKYFEADKKIGENYDTLGVIVATIKIITSELLELFKLLWDIRTGKNKNKKLYDSLPLEYKRILYNIRGVYFKNKGKYIDAKRKGDVYQTKILRIKDIYNIIKCTCTSREIINLIIARRQLKNIKEISNKCDYISLKMMSIIDNAILS